MASISLAGESSSSLGWQSFGRDRLDENTVATLLKKDVMLDFFL